MRHGKFGIDMFLNTFKGKKILVTGHTGFKGGWLSLWLSMTGADVLGYALAPNTTPSFYKVIKLENTVKSIFGDIRDKESLNRVFNEFQPEVVFHLAAQPLVRLSYFEPVMTYETNVIGTLNVLEAARNCSSVKAFVNITSDKCYENKEVDYGYCETDPMGGYDMYSSSKGCAEILTSSYRRSFLNDGNPFLLASGRAGNVIGGGDWALDRLVPDCARFISKNEPIVIRNPVATRPWQHVLEPLSGYLLLAQKLLNGEKEFADGFNFGPEDDSILTVAEVARKVVRYWEHGEVTVNKPDNLHEANLLKLNIEKAKNLLKWNPTYSADQAIQKTVEWYKNFYNNEQMYDFTLKQINEYAEVCKNNGKITQKSC